MLRPSTLLAPVYLIAAIVGLIGTWYLALASLATERNYLGDVVASGQPWGSLENLLLTCAGLVFVLIEGLRQRVPYLWALVAAVLVLGPAFGVPLFMFSRQRRLIRLDATYRAQLARNGVIFTEPGGRPAQHWFG